MGETETNPDSGTSKKPIFPGWLTTAITTCITILTLIVTLFALQYYLDYLVNKKVHEENFIDNVASRVRPFVIFDQNGSILAEKGARKFINQIEVERSKKGGIPTRIKVDFTQAFGVVPILECLDDRFVITHKRGKMYEVDYDLGPIAEITLRNSISNWRFRLEVVR
jgi:hypothetical protein